MKSFLVTFVVLALVSSISAKCEFKIEGNGNVQDPMGKYIKDSVFVWDNIITEAFNHATPKGVTILKEQWQAETTKFNDLMLKGDVDNAFKSLYKVCDSFKNVAPEITKPDLASHFTQAYDGFKKVLDGKDFKAINKYMVDIYPVFKTKVGC